MQIITAEEFEINCLSLIDQVEASGEPLTIFKDGKAIARLLPLPIKRDPFGALQGAEYKEDDIISPIDVEWNVLKDD